VSRSRRTATRVAGWLVAGLLLGVVACSRTAEPGESPWQAEGPIRVIDGRTWVVGPHLITLAPDATIVGAPEVGASARPSGMRGRGGQLVVRRAEVAPPGQPAPAPGGPPRSEPTVRPTAQPTARPTARPTPTPTVRPAVEPTRPKPAPAPRRVPGGGEDEDD
jgi:hypothetical protein